MLNIWTIDTEVLECVKKQLFFYSASHSLIADVTPLPSEKWVPEGVSLIQGINDCNWGLHQDNKAIVLSS